MATSQIFRARARAALDALARRSWFTGLAGPPVRALLARSLRRLRAHPAVREVLLRGSLARGTFRPLASDADLVVRMREPDGLDFASTRSVLERLRRVRRLDPSIRDDWHMLLGDTEWPVFARHGALFDVQEWCDESGRRPCESPPPVDRRLHLAAAWRRQRMWTESALRAVLPGPGGRRDDVLFAAAEKKTRSLASDAFGGEPPDGRRAPPRSEDDRLDRLASLLGLRDACAAGIVAELREPLPRLPRPSPDPPPRWMDEAAEVLHGDLRAAALLVHAGTAVFVFRDPPELSAWTDVLRRLRRFTSRAAVRAVPESLATFALEASLLEMRVVAADEDLVDRALADWQPLLAREHAVVEALLIGTELRVLCDRPVAAGSPPLITQRLARLLVYLSEGRLVRDREAALAIACRGDRAGPGTDPRGPWAPEDWFRVNARLFERLVRVVESGSG